jgi:hypothetical protein
LSYCKSGVGLLCESDYWEEGHQGFNWGQLISAALASVPYRNQTVHVPWLRSMAVFHIGEVALSGQVSDSG